jgi:polysaccharide pyruvyl transferase WcaK-like protein
MTIKKTPRKIGVFSHGGTKNLGDEALLAAVIQNVRLRIPDADVVGFTINPEDTLERHGILSFPVRQIGRRALSNSAGSKPSVGTTKTTAREGSSGGAAKIKNALKILPGVRPAVLVLRSLAENLRAIFAEPKFLFDSYRRLEGVDLLLVAGSQQLNDGYGGAWGFPYTLFKWTLLAKLAGTRVAILSVGAGPISSPLSKIFFKRVLNLVDYRSYRDAISSRMMESMGIKGAHPVLPDLVYSLQLPAPKAAPTGAAHIVVGANPVPFFDGRYWPTPDPARYQDYVRKFARFAKWLDKSGHSVLFFPTQTRADVLTIDDIRRAMNGHSQSPNLLPGRPMQTLEDLVSEISRADFVVANRYHGILISLMMNKPVLGVAYHEKSRALLEQAGQGEYVLNIADFRTEDLIERFSALEAAAPAVKKRIAERMAPLRKALDEQYDTVLGLIGIQSASGRASQS